jgi:hypothetical protein
MRYIIYKRETGIIVSIMMREPIRNSEINEIRADENCKKILEPTNDFLANSCNDKYWVNTSTYELELKEGWTPPTLPTI